MRQITVVYHKEDGSWWAESPNLAGWSAAADTREELQVLVREGVSFSLDDEPHVILEAGWAPQASTSQRTRSGEAAPAISSWFGYETRRAPSAFSTNPRMVLT